MIYSQSLIDGLETRMHGAMSFRFVVQPLVALLFAVRDGRRDARDGRAPYFWALFTDAENRREMLRDGWKSIGKVFVVAVVLDLVFQLVVVKEFQTGAALLTGVTLALVPYVLVRGPVNRLARRR